MNVAVSFSINQTVEIKIEIRKNILRVVTAKGV